MLRVCGQTRCLHQSLLCHSNILLSTRHKNNTAQPNTDKCPGSTSIIFHRLTVVYVSFCSLMKGTAPKICMLWFVLLNIFFSFLFLTFDVFGTDHYTHIVKTGKQQGYLVHHLTLQTSAEFTSLTKNVSTDNQNKALLFKLFKKII